MKRTVEIGESESITLGELSNRAARLFADRECLYFQGRRETFAETQAKIDRLARGLIALGVGKGDKVALWMTNRPEWVHAMFAVAKIGAVLVPVNTRFRSSDLEYVVQQSDTSTLITMEASGPIRYLDMVLELCPDLRDEGRENYSTPVFPELRRVICFGGEDLPRGVYGWEHVLAAADKVTPDELAQREGEVRPTDTQFMMYTSGTTGFPKGVMHCHNVIRNACIATEMLQAKADDCTVMFLPLFHVFGYFEGPLITYIAGARMALTETFDPAEVLELIEREKGTIIHGFDTHWQDLMDHPDFAGRDCSSVRTGILAAGLPSTAPVAERAWDTFVPTCTGWGMTECMPGALISHIGDTRYHATHTSGRPPEGYEFRIVDPATGDELGPGEPGEMCVRSFSVMQGYYKKPEETAKAIDAEGFLHSGDMGVREADGYIRFLGRYKDMLKIGGENVDPVEVEAFFLRHPDVSRIQVVGVPDRRLSEIAVAFVVAEPGRSVTEEQLREFAKGKIASFKVPRHFVFVREYPMTSTGKVKRFELREAAKRELGLGEQAEATAAEISQSANELAGS